MWQNCDVRVRPQDGECRIMVLYQGKKESIFKGYYVSYFSPTLANNWPSSEHEPVLSQNGWLESPLFPYDGRSSQTCMFSSNTESRDEEGHEYCP